MLCAPGPADRHSGADAVQALVGACREFAACRTRDEGDWLRDGFGADAGFTVFVAEASDTVIGTATCSQRAVTGWNGPVVFLQDLFVEPAYHKHGVARDVGSPIIELTMHRDNPAQKFYRDNGFQLVPQCLTYVLAGTALEQLARNQESLPLAG